MKKKAFDSVFYICYIVDMGTLNIREFPDALRRELKKLCLDRNTTLQAEVVKILKEEVDRAKKGKL